MLLLLLLACVCVWLCNKNIKLRETPLSHLIAYLKFILKPIWLFNGLWSFSVIFEDIVVVVAVVDRLNEFLFKMQSIFPVTIINHCRSGQPKIERNGNLNEKNCGHHRLRSATNQNKLRAIFIFSLSSVFSWSLVKGKILYQQFSLCLPVFIHHP